MIYYLQNKRSVDHPDPFRRLKDKSFEHKWAQELLDVKDTFLQYFSRSTIYLRRRRIQWYNQRQEKIVSHHND